ncbi:MAG: sigma 54-interacting transcriptional regulator [Acidobacteriota bacterium]|nr:sigma 54-interacting transcriptional regulator [Acidobacteriota bacterium]
MEGIRALVVEPDSAVRERLRQALEDQGIQCHSASHVDAADAIVRRERFDVVFADPRLVDSAKLNPESFPIHVAVMAEVPVDGTEWWDRASTDSAALSLLTRRLVDRLELARRERVVRERLASGLGLRGLVGVSSASERLRTQIGDLAGGELPVWVSGETGVGKLHLIRTLQECSSWSDGALVRVDAGSLADLPPDSDSADVAELRRRIAGGLLMVRGLEDLDDEAQTRIVEGWERGWFHDATSSHGARCRVCVVTRETPERLVAEGRVLESATRRLATAHAHVPTLRKRSEDIPRLVDFFLREIVEINRLEALRVSGDALDALGRYEWPGNVRELRACIEHAAILATDGVVRLRDLPERIRNSLAEPVSPSGSVTASFRDAKHDVVSRFERSYLTSLMRAYNGNVTAAAEKAGMLRSALQRLLRKHGLRSSSFRPGRRASAEPMRDAGHEEI